MKKKIGAMIAMFCFILGTSCDAQACVTVGNGGDYQVDPSGCVE